MDSYSQSRIGENFLSLPAKRDSFSVIRERLGEIAAELDIPAKIRNQILVMADEIFTNIVLYGYPEGGGTADVSIDFEPEKNSLVLKLSDAGIPFNPLEIPAPELDRSMSEDRLGGFGIHLVRKYADVMEYSHENGRNILVLKKHI